MKGINIFTVDVIKDFSYNYDRKIQVLWKKGNKKKKSLLWKCLKWCHMAFWNFKLCFEPSGPLPLKRRNAWCNTCSSFERQLFLVKKFVKYGEELIKKGGSCLLSKYWHLITTYKLENNLYKLGISNMTNEVLANVVSSNLNANLWHKRLGHIGQGCLQTIIYKDIAIWKFRFGWRQIFSVLQILQCCEKII
jgi:hypothetical protein